MTKRSVLCFINGEIPIGAPEIKQRQVKTMKEEMSQCARCPFKAADRVCRKEDGKHPDNCPTMARTELEKSVRQRYLEPRHYEFARQATLQEREGYSNHHLGYERLRPAKPRIEEIIEFAKKMGYRKLGMAFCIGLRTEAALVDRIFREHGFELASAVCKVGRVGKEVLGLGDEGKITPGTFESMCNPILQAEILNEEQTEFNILLGLCVGHDSLFFQHAAAPCTVLAVKDRVTGHNPLAAVYTLGSYYRAL